MSEWQKSETAPKDGTWILVYAPKMHGQKILQARWHQPGNPKYPGMWAANGAVISTRQVTHWCALPPPPEGSE